MSTFEDIIAANYTQAEITSTAGRVVTDYVREASTVDGFRETDQWLALTARSHAAELMGR